MPTVPSEPAPTVHDRALRVAVAAPVPSRPFLDLLGPEAARLPEGYPGATPVWQLARDLVAAGHEVAVVALAHDAEGPTRAARGRLTLVYDHHRPRHSMRDFMRRERDAVRRALLALDPAPDLVHAHWCYEYALAALDSGLPTLVTLRDWAPAIVRHMDVRVWPYWLGRAAMYFLTLARARHLVVNSPYLAARVRPFTTAAVETIPNGVADGAFVRPPDGAAAAAPLPPPAVDAALPLLLSVNNGFTPRKNVTTLLEAFASLRHLHPAARLELVGLGFEPEGPCAAWARRRRLADGVAFLGPLPHADILARMREATVLVHPSLEESFGMTLVEAMSQATPVVAGRHAGAVPWVLAGGRAGVLVDTRDPRDLAAGVAALLADEGLRAAVAARGHAHAWRTFRQSVVTECYLEAYRRLLEEHQGRRGPGRSGGAHEP